MINQTKKVIIIVIALTFVIIGAAGLVLPLLPGLLFIILGLLLISMYNPRFEYWLSSLTKKNPTVHKMAEDLKNFLARIIGKP